MFLNKSPVTIQDKIDRNTGYWCHQLVSVCYITIIINLLVLIAFWYFFALNREGLNSVRYWARYIILPSSIMLIANIAADMFVRAKRFSLEKKEYVSIFLMLFFCTLLCMQHNVLAVLLATFIIPIMLSTLYANMKMTRLTYFLAQGLLILSGLRMNASSTRIFSLWIWAEILTASGLLLASYFLAKVLIISVRNKIVNLNSIQRDKMELEEELNLDPLTGLYNRKAYDEYFSKIMEECRLSSTNLSIAVLDLDDFKQVNDDYGHAAGDRVLLRFSAVLRNVLNEKIYPFRVGGEEFVLLFQGFSAREAANVCEDVLAIMKTTSLPELDGRSISFSGGVADMHKGVTDPMELFKAADTALYSAKKSGKEKILIQF